MRRGELSLDIKEFLEAVCTRFHREESLAHDPLAFPRRYPGPLDREVVGLIAASFAFGRVASFMPKVERLLSRLGPLPASTIAGMSDEDCEAASHGVVHRFVGPGDVASLLRGLRGVLWADGALKPSFLAGFERRRDVFEGLVTLAAALVAAAGTPGPGFLVRPPRPGSPSKRLNLFLRWMVRDDGFDLGLWREVPTSALVIPLDVHVVRIAQSLGLLPVRISGPRWKDAVALTDRLRAFDPLDPVRFDFALSHLGMSGKIR